MMDVSIKLKANCGVCSKKDKMSHCHSVTETLCTSSPAIKTNPEFSKYLTMAMEMYFTLLDDGDADVRLTADDSLNRAIKNLCETNVGRLQVCIQF